MTCAALARLFVARFTGGPRTHVASLQAVLSQGRIYPRAAIQAKLAEYQAHYASPLVDAVSVLLAKLALRRAIATQEH